MSILSNMKGVAAKDQQMIREAETMMGPEPEEMGFIKNMTWGRIREDLVFPYPEVSAAEKAKADALLQRLDDYLKNEHPAIQIDQEEFIPEWAIDRLFEIGVLGMTIPEQYGGLGLGVASYNRVLERIGRTCGSTAVVVSAHQSIGCKALMLFGTEEQKNEYLPKVAREYLSAFCLSEPQVGSDAAGQETTCRLSDDGTHYILNGEKKWSTSGALAGLFTVMAKHKITDPKTGKTKEGVTALIVTPDMEGVDIFQKNRSKTGIRGTWQARVRFTDVKVPAKQLLHKEGQGLKVALTCLNYGRCTLSAGVTGAAKQARDQATKWVRTRHQFNRPLADFELVQQHVARMAAYCYAMDAMLYMTCGFLDRHDKDIMVETAACKVFCSDYGWKVIDDGMQIMGGEGYVTENEYDRIWRDNRIHRIVEGSNEVMQSFVFAYGGKQLAEYMLGVLNAVEWDEETGTLDNLKRIALSAVNPEIVKKGTPLAAEIFLGKKQRKADVQRLHPALQGQADLLAKHVQTHSREFKLASKRLEETIVTRQVMQARIADNAILMYAWSCVLSKLDMQLRKGERGAAFERDKAAALHFLRLADLQIRENNRGLTRNADQSMVEAAQAQYALTDTQANDEFYIHESSPTDKGTGKPIQTQFVKQFPGDAYIQEGGSLGDGAPATEPANAGDGAPEVKKPAKKS
ncbi:MAG: acyl-CoA dehydrogenase family protein [Rhodothermales bacterium]